MKSAAGAFSAVPGQNNLRNYSREGLGGGNLRYAEQNDQRKEEEAPWRAQS